MRSGALRYNWSGTLHAVLPALVALALCVPGITQGALATDTAWYSAIAMQAWQAAASGDPAALWTLRGVADQPYFNKPPLGFWLNGVPLLVFGPTVLASRLGSVFACVLCVMASARLGRLLAGRVVGFSTALVLALTWEFIRHSHAFSLDLWMTLFLTLAAASVAESVARDQPRRLVHAGLWIGAALMVKPLVPLIAILMFGAWILVAHRTRWLTWLPLCLAAAAAVAAPWHISMWAMHGDSFAAQYFGREIIDRAAAGPVADFNRGSGSPWYYFNVILGSYWPWLATFAFGLIAFVRREGGERLHSALCFACIWTLGWLLLLSIFPDKRPRYLLVLYPVASLFTAVLMTRLAPISVRVAWRRIGRWALPVAAVAAITISASPIRLHRPEPAQWTELFTWLREQGSPDVHAGGFAPQRSAQVFLGTGRWPTPLRATNGRTLLDPPAGSLIIYHRRDGLAPGESEIVEFSSGDLIVTRLVLPPWTPAIIADPGEGG